MEPSQFNIPKELFPPIKRWPVYVVLNNIRSAFNVGSAFRSSDLAGASEVILQGCCAFPPNEKLAKTSLGAEQYLDWRHYQSAQSVTRYFEQKNIPIVTVDNGPQAIAYDEFEWPSPVAVVLGNEVTGVEQHYFDKQYARVQLPSYGVKKTLNVSTCFGIVLFEILRQYRQNERQTLS